MKSILYFTSPTCVPCKTLGLLLKIVAKEDGMPVETYSAGNPGDITTFDRYNVRGTPTIIYFDSDGVVLNRRSGAMNRKELNEFLGI